MIGSRIREARKNLGMSQNELGSILSVTKASVSKWESGDNEPKNIDLLAKALKVNTRWLRDGKGEKKINEESNILDSSLKVANWEEINQDTEEFVTVPVLDLELCAGHGIENDENKKESYTLPFRAYTLKKMGIPVTKTRVVRIFGDSMNPRLFDKDAVSINMADTKIRDGKMYAIRVGSVQKIKVLIKNFDGSVTLRSFNPEFEDEIISSDRIENGEFQVLGRVWWSSSLYD